MYLLKGTSQLPYLDLNVSDSTIPLTVLGHFDDGASDAVQIFGGFPFANTTHTFLFVRIILAKRVGKDSYMLSK